MPRMLHSTTINLLLIPQFHLLPLLFFRALHSCRFKSSASMGRIFLSPLCLRKSLRECWIILVQFRTIQRIVRSELTGSGGCVGRGQRFHPPELSSRLTDGRRYGHGDLPKWVAPSRDRFAGDSGIRAGSALWVEVKDVTLIVARVPSTFPGDEEVRV
jgi:hypothetical protein